MDTQPSIWANAASACFNGLHAEAVLCDMSILQAADAASRLLIYQQYTTMQSKQMNTI
jgi:hypothetical protein